MCHFAALAIACLSIATKAHATPPATPLACSTREPVCLVAAEPETSGGAGRYAGSPHASTWLPMAERSYGALRVLGLPRPASLPLRLPAPKPGATACAAETGLARAVLEASLSSAIDPRARAEESAILRTALLELVTPCGDLAARDQQKAQRPEAGWPSSAPAFLGWLDRRAASSTGRLLAGIVSLLPRADLLTVLRENTRDLEFGHSTFADSVAAFGLSRFFEPGVPAEWTLEWPQRPRALLLASIAPLGASAVEVRLPPGEEPSLRVETEWEQRAEMRVAVVSLDAQGKSLGISWVASPARATFANTTVVPAPGARALRIVVAHVGDPFDKLLAREAPFEPHAAIVTLAGL